MIWHYTTGESFISIQSDGFINPATDYIPVGERPIVWFSNEPFWEPTVSKGVVRPDGTIQDLGMDDLHKRKMLLIRIGVDETVAPHRWSELKSLSGMAPQISSALGKAAKSRGGNPSRWSGTFDPVPAKDWKKVEFFSGKDWLTFDPPGTSAEPVEP